MIYIGTSGFNYKHWKERFYPENIRQKDWLEYYATFFDTVELNVSFYGLPSQAAFDHWRESVPTNFVYSVKGSRYVTHNKKLHEVEKPLDVFMTRAKRLQEKLGVVLWQLPHNFGLNLERFESFLILLKKYKVRSAFEFRNNEWFTDEVYRLLKKYNCALVVADSPSGTSPVQFTADFVYVRFHGGKILYGSDYSENELKNWAKMINDWSINQDVYVYFNNDANAFAVKNGLSLKALLQST